MELEVAKDELGWWARLRLWLRRRRRASGYFYPQEKARFRGESAHLRARHASRLPPF